MSNLKPLRCLRSNSQFCSSRYLASKNTYTIDFCSQCHHAYVSDSISSEDLSLHYRASNKYAATSFAADLKLQSFAGSRSDAYRYLQIIQSASVESLPRFLEVGAGWGYAAERAAQMGWDADVIEYSTDCVESLRTRLPSKSIVFQGSFEEYSSLSNSKYDAILMSQVLEHALSPLLWLETAHRLLKPGGVLLVAVPLYQGFYRFLGMNDPFISPPEHLNFFTRHSLRFASSQCGFEHLKSSGYSRIPYSNIHKRCRSSILAIMVYRSLQCLFYIVDLTGFSMVQIGLFRKR
jgi:SAM-dependent methyltransferase